MPEIRLYRKEDRDAVYDICIRTGYLGGDARGMYADPSILPEIFAGPYVDLEPDVCFVVDDGEAVVGYVVATTDTGTFVRRFREEWIPQVADRYNTNAYAFYQRIGLHLVDVPTAPQSIAYFGMRLPRLGYSF